MRGIDNRQTSDTDLNAKPSYALHWGRVVLEWATISGWVNSFGMRFVHHLLSILNKNTR